MKRKLQQIALHFLMSCGLTIAAAAQNGNLAPTPPMGWNSWNHFAEKIDARTVRAQADAMIASGMKDAGYVYINIDDTWEDKRERERLHSRQREIPRHESACRLCSQQRAEARHLFLAGGHDLRGTHEMRTVYTKMHEALKKTGRPIVLALCEYGWNNVWEWGDNVGGNRIRGSPCRSAQSGFVLLPPHAIDSGRSLTPKSVEAVAQ